MPVTPRVKRTITRVILPLLLLALLVGLWFGLQRPRQLHIASRYVLKSYDPKDNGYAFTQNGRWLPTGLLRWSIPETSRQPVKLTFDSWDGKGHWQITTPAAKMPERPRAAYEIYRPPLECSPNGHYIALLFTDGPQVCVFSWHDGKPDVAVKLTGIPGKLETDYRLYVADDGRLWIHSAFVRTCRLWCIDGRRVAVGTYTTPFPPYSKEFYAFQMAADGSVLVPEQIEQMADDHLSQYVSLKVRKDRIIATPRYVLNGHVQVIENGVISFRKDYYDAGGRISEKTARQRLKRPEAETMHDHLPAQFIEIGKKRWLIPREGETVALPDGKEWSVTTYRKPIPVNNGGQGWSGLDEGACSADGRYLLMVEDTRPSVSPRYLPTLARMPYVKDTLIRRLRPWRLSLYERPGKLRAGLTLTAVDPASPKGEYRAKIGKEFYRINGWSISPDGRYIGLNAYREGTNQFEFVVCRW